MLTTNPLKHWALKLWDFDKHYRWPEKRSAPARKSAWRSALRWPHRGRDGSVDIQTDGDLMFDAGALWFAAKYKVPLLCVMHNNRAYYNDWEHQIRWPLRGTPEKPISAWT